MRAVATQTAVAGTTPARSPVRVERLKTLGFRNLADTAFSLNPGLTLLHGPNGAGKTNLLEALYFGLVGRSCRTARLCELIAFGSSLTRVEVTTRGGTEAHHYLASFASSSEGGRRHLRDGGGIGPAEAFSRPAIALFMPDRLALVKGAPAARRAHLDRLIAALWSTRVEARLRFGRALAQRNALLARIRAGGASADSLAAWDLELAREAVSVMEARAAAVALLGEPFAEAAAALGIPEPAAIAYRPRSDAQSPEQLVEQLVERRARDVERARTTHGPHLDELEVRLNGRSLRHYGSQGQQRMALLALLFAEREVLLAEREASPLMLLDDLMSELDPERRELLVERLASGGQAVITATHRTQVPDCEREELEVREGRVESPAAEAAP